MLADDDDDEEKAQQLKRLEAAIHFAVGKVVDETLELEYTNHSTSSSAHDNHNYFNGKLTASNHFTHALASVVMSRCLMLGRDLKAFSR